MKSSICDICLNSGILCSSCQKKMGSGVVSKNDFEILRLIRQEENETKSLKDVEIKKIIEEDKVVVLVCSRGDLSKIVGKGGAVVKKLGKDLGKSIKVVEESNDKREFLQRLIFPTPILNLNIIYTQDGEKYRVKIPGDSRLSIPKDSFLNIAKGLLGKDVEIEWDRKDAKEESIEDKIKKVLKKMESSS